MKKNDEKEITALGAEIDLDAVLDYERLYEAELEKTHVSGENLIALCPFHDDRHVGNFSVSLTSGRYHCFACGRSGNYVKFVAEKYGISTRDAFVKICRENHIPLRIDRPADDFKTVPLPKQPETPMVPLPWVSPEEAACPAGQPGPDVGQPAPDAETPKNPEVLLKALSAALHNTSEETGTSGKAGNDEPDASGTGSSSPACSAEPTAAALEKRENPEKPEKPAETAAPAAPAPVEGTVVARTSYSVEEYAAEKSFDAEELRRLWGMTDGKADRNGPYLILPYCDENGNQITYRKRYRRESKQRFAWRSGSTGALNSKSRFHFCFYGLQLLDTIRKIGYAILVEGESDTQALWKMGFPALGVPGAANARTEWFQRYLMDLPLLYIHQEPDQGGETFVTLITRRLTEAGWPGELRVFSCSDEDLKDPSELWCWDGEGAVPELKQLLAGARKLRLRSDADPEGKPGKNGKSGKNGKNGESGTAGREHGLSETTGKVSMPFHNVRNLPVLPAGYELDERGIWVVDQTSGMIYLLCATPMTISRKLSVLGSDEQRIELLYVVNGKQKSLVCKRSELLNSRTIVQTLSDKGIAVTSENAKPVVKYLQDLEAENSGPDGCIPVCELTEQTGWHDHGRFMPFFSDGLTMDPVRQSFLHPLQQKGSKDAWLSAMNRCRKNWRFRFLLSAAFAAPMISLLGVRIFCVYNWGDSRGGKTAALKAALSVYGDPDRLMMTYNATDNALESYCAAYNDLPVGIDEKQIAGRELSSVIYRLCEGYGRSRLSKNLSARKVYSWNNLILTTGEQTIVNSRTMTGVSTRIVEIHGSPFRDYTALTEAEKDAERKKAEQSASHLYAVLSENYGWAGPEFLGHLRSAILNEAPDSPEQDALPPASAEGSSAGSDCAYELPDSGDSCSALSAADGNTGTFPASALAPAQKQDLTLSKLRMTYESFKMLLEQQCPENNGSHIQCVALICTADFYADRWIFGGEADPKVSAQLGIRVLNQLREEQDRDVSDNAIKALSNWCVQNACHFDFKSQNIEYYGLGSGKNDGTFYVLTDKLQNACEMLGYDWRKTKAELIERGMLRFAMDGTKRRYSLMPEHRGHQYGLIEEKFFGKYTPETTFTDESESGLEISSLFELPA